MKQQTFLTVLIAIVLGSASSAVAGASRCTIALVEEWPIRLLHNHLIVDGAVNGRKVGIMLDTGATLSLILRATAARLDLPRRDAPGYRMFGIGGETRVEVASIDEFRIGQATLKDFKLLVAGENDFADGVDALLGEDFLHEFDVEFDLAHSTVRLFRPKDCDRVSLAYWSPDAAGEVEIESATDAGHPEIMLTVQINGRTVRAKLDSGASSSVLTKHDAAAAGVTPETQGVVAVGKSGGLGKNAVDTWIGPFESFAIGNEIVRNTTISFADLYKDVKYTQTGSQVRKSVAPLQPMLLGADFLRAHRVFVAHSQRKLYFTYAGGPVFQTGAQPPPGGPTPDGAAASSTGTN